MSDAAAATCSCRPSAVSGSCPIHKGQAFQMLAQLVQWRGVYPGMCIDPSICRGKSHCPRDYSCCE